MPCGLSCSPRGHGKSSANRKTRSCASESWSASARTPGCASRTIHTVGTLADALCDAAYCVHCSRSRRAQRASRSFAIASPCCNDCGLATGALAGSQISRTRSGRFRASLLSIESRSAVLNCDQQSAMPNHVLVPIGHLPGAKLSCGDTFLRLLLFWLSLALSIVFAVVSFVLAIRLLVRGTTPEPSRVVSCHLTFVFVSIACSNRTTTRISITKSRKARALATRSSTPRLWLSLW